MNHPERMIKSIGLVCMFCLTTLFVEAQDVDVFIQKADSLAEQPEKALEILNRAVTDNPDSEELLKVRAEVFEELKQYGKAADDYRKLAVLLPEEETVWYSLGRNQFENRQYEESIQSMNRAIGLNAQYLPAFHIKIKALLHLNRFDAALKVSDSTLMIGGTAMSYFLQGEVNKQLNSRQKAEWAYGKAIKADKGFIEAYIALSDLSAGMNKIEETLVNADAALSINPDSEEALIARSRGLALLKQYNDAIDDASYVIRLNPSNMQAYYWRGTYYRESNRNQEALKDFNQVLKAEPDHWQALAGRADSYAGTGNKNAALTDYQRLLAEASKYPEKETITQLANQRIFELNRENHAPQLVLEGAAPDNFDLPIPDDRKTITLKGKITDESPIGKLMVNGQEAPLKAIDGGFEFAVEVKLENQEEIRIEVADIYDNVNKLAYHLVRNETIKPQITLFTPKTDETGSIVVTSDNSASLYVEGRITDESSIASIVVEGKAVDFDHESANPTFSSIVDITGKSRFSIVVTDQYGNTTEQVYTIEKITASSDNKDATMLQEQQIPVAGQIISH
jgi:tetratricopeptide (TPR) repeat protein